MSRTIVDLSPLEEREPLRVAMIGAGKMARFHGDTLRAIRGVILCGISSRSESSGARLTKELGFERAYTDYERMLDELCPAAVFVAVSHSSSYAAARAVVSRGIPCMLEKPVAYSAAEVGELAQLAGRTGALVVVGVNRRYYSVIQQALLAVIQHGPVSGLLVEAHEPILSYRSRRQFEGWLYDQWLMANSIHAIDLLRMVGGEVERVSGFGLSDSEPFGDHFSVSTRHTGDILGSFVAHWNSGGGMSMKIFGTGVIAELVSLESGFISYASGRRIKIQPDEVDRRFKPGLFAQNVAFLRCVCDGSTPAYPASDLADNCRTMELIEQIRQTVSNSR